MYQAQTMDTDPHDGVRPLTFAEMQVVVGSYETAPLSEWDEIILKGTLAYDERAARDLFKDGLWLDLAHHYARSAHDAAIKLGDVIAQERLQALGEQIREKMGEPV